jgi:DNA-binding beta-propeller fold protein YncE
VTNFGTSTISQFTIDSSTGALTAITTTTNPTVGTNPSFIVFDPGGKYAFVANSGSKTISEMNIGSAGGLSTNGNTIAVQAVPRAIALTK